MDINYNYDLPLDLSTHRTKSETHDDISRIRISCDKNVKNFFDNVKAVDANGSNILNRIEIGTCRKLNKKTLLACEVCKKCFDRPSLLKRHTRTHTGEKPHVCAVCTKGFSTSSSLNTHRRIHTGEKPHKCQKCGKCFTASSNLYYHRMTHTKDKPHKCLHCPKSFPTPGDLRAHSHAHTGAWPYKCYRCPKGFSKQAGLRAHLLLHSGEKPYTCTICGRQFTQSCNLKAHVKIHHMTASGSAVSQNGVECSKHLNSNALENNSTEMSTRRKCLNESKFTNNLIHNPSELLSNIHKNILTNYWVQFGLQSSHINYDKLV